MDDLEALAGLLVDSATGGDGEALPGVFEAQRRDLDRHVEELVNEENPPVDGSSQPTTDGSIGRPQHTQLQVAMSVSNLLASQTQTRRRRPPVTSTFALAVNQYLTRHPAFLLSQTSTFSLQQTTVEFKDLLEDHEGELMRETVLDVQRHRLWIGLVQETLEIERLSAVYDSPAAALEAMLEPLQDLAAGSTSAPCSLYFDHSSDSSLVSKIIPAGPDEPEINVTTTYGLASGILRNCLGRAAFYILRGPLFSPKQQLALGFLECKVRSRIDELPVITEDETGESADRLVVRRTLTTASSSRMWQTAAERIAVDVYDRAAWHSLLDCIKDMPIHTVRHIWQAFCFYFPTCGPYITHYVYMEMEVLEGSGCSTRIGQGNIKLMNENGIRDGADRDEAEAKFKGILRLANIFCRHLGRCRSTGLFTAYFKFIHEFVPLPENSLDACYRATLVDFVGNHPSSTTLWLQYISWGSRKVGANMAAMWARKLYHRALSIPLEDRERVVELYTDFEKEKIHGSSFRLDDETEKKFKRAENSHTELGPLWRRINLVDFEPCPFANPETLLQAQCRHGRFDATEDAAAASYMAESDEHTTEWDAVVLDNPFRRPILSIPPGHATSQAYTWTGYPGARNKPRPFGVQEDAEIWAAWDALLLEELPYEKGGAHFSFFSRELYARRCIEVLWKRVSCFPFHVEAWLDLVKYILAATALPLQVQELEARKVLEAAREVLPDNLLFTCEFADYLRRGRELADEDRGHALFWGLAQRVVKKIAIFQQSVPLVTDLGKEFAIWRAAMKRSQHGIQSVNVTTTDSQYESLATHLQTDLDALSVEFDRNPFDVLGSLSEADWIEHSRNVLIARQQVSISLSLFTSLTSIFAQWMQWARLAYGVEEGAFHVRLVARHAIKDSNLLAAIMGEVRRMYKAFSIPFSTVKSLPFSGDDDDGGSMLTRSIWRAVDLEGVCSAPSADQQLGTNPTSFDGLVAPQRCPITPVSGTTDKARLIVAKRFRETPNTTSEHSEMDADLQILFKTELQGLSGVGEHDGDRDDAVDRPLIFSPKLHLSLFSAYCSTWSTIEACFSQSPETALEVIRGWFRTIQRLFETTRDRGWTAMECGIDRSFFAACEEAWKAGPATVGGPILEILTQMLDMLRADFRTDTYVEQRWCTSLSHRISVSGEASTPGQSIIKEHFSTLVESLTMLQDEAGTLSKDDIDQVTQTIERSRKTITSVSNVDPLGAMLAFLGTPSTTTTTQSDSKSAAAIDVGERVRLYASMWAGGGSGAFSAGPSSGGSDALAPTNGSSFGSAVLQGRQTFTSEDVSGSRKAPNVVADHQPLPRCNAISTQTILRDAVVSYQNAVDRSLTNTMLTPFSRVDHTTVATAKTSLVSAHYNRTAATTVDQQRELLLASGNSELRRCAALQTSRHGIKGAVAWYQGAHHRSFGWCARLHDQVLADDASSNSNGTTPTTALSDPHSSSLQSLVLLRSAMEADVPRTEIYKDRTVGGQSLTAQSTGPEQRGDESYDELVAQFKLTPVAAIAGVEDLLGHCLRSYDPVDPTSGQANMTASTQLMQYELLRGTCALIAADDLTGGIPTAKSSSMNVGRSFSSRVDHQIRKAELLTMLMGTDVYGSRGGQQAEEEGANAYPLGQWVDFDLPVNERLQARQKKLLRQHTARGRGGGDRGGRGGRGGGRGGLGMQAGMARGQSLLALANEEEHTRIKSRSKHLRRRAQGSNDFEDTLLSSSDSSSSSESGSEKDDEFVLQQVARMLGYDALSLASDAAGTGDVPAFSRHHVSTSNTMGVRCLEYAMDSVSLLLATKQEEVEREEQAARAKMREQKRRVVDREDFVELGAEVRKAVPQLASDPAAGGGGGGLDPRSTLGDFRGQGIFYAPRDTASAQEALRSRAERTVARLIARDLEAGNASPDQATIANMVAETLQRLQDQAAEDEIHERQQERMSRGRGGRGSGQNGRGGHGDSGGRGGRAAGRASLTTAGRMRRRVAEGITTKEYPVCDVWAPVWISSKQRIYEDGFYVESEENRNEAENEDDGSVSWQPLCLGEKRPRDDEVQPSPSCPSTTLPDVSSIMSSFAQITSVVPTRLNSDSSDVNGLRGNTPLSPVHFLASLLPLHTYESELVADSLANIAAVKLVFGSGRGSVKIRQSGADGSEALGEDGSTHCSEGSRLRTDVLVNVLRESPSFLVSTNSEADGGL